MYGRRLGLGFEHEGAPAPLSPHLEPPLYHIANAAIMLRSHLISSACVVELCCVQPTIGQWGPLRTTQCEMSPSHLLRPQYLHARGRSATTHVISSLCCIDCTVISVCYDYSMRGCELLRDGRFAFLKWAYITRGNIAYADRSLDSVSLVVFVTVSLSVFAL